jgi:hypothetical protein
MAGPKALVATSYSVPPAAIPDTPFVCTPATEEDPFMPETEGQFKGIRGFLWLTAGFLLLVAAIGSANYIVAHLFKYFVSRTAAEAEERKVRCRK